MNISSYFNHLKASSRRAKRDYHYGNYPKGVNLHPDGEVHKKLISYLMSLAKSSYDVMSARHSSWKEVDQKLNVYIDLSNEEKDDQEDDPRRPVSMVVPLSYATRESLLAYRMSAFLADPIFRYDWVDPNDAIGVILLQKIISQQVNKKKMALALNTMWSDDITYGFGALVDDWVVERRQVTRRTIDEGGNLIPFDTYEITYEGNELTPFDPYNTLPDPSFPIHRVDKMTFFGGLERTNYYDLLTLEKEQSDIFNVKYIKDYNVGKSVLYSATASTTGRYDSTGLNPETALSVNNENPNVDVLWMFTKIIPKDFKLSSASYPEIWVFAIAGDRVIIKAKKLTNNHNRIPAAVIASNSDDHTTVPMSLLEIEFPIQHAVDWLWSAHVINVRKHLNNMLIVDPSRVNMNDLVDTKYGMIARLRAKAFGTGVKDAVQQLNLTDVTRQNVQDIGFLMDIEQRVTAVSAQMQGLFAKRNERISATEARDTRLSGLNRLAKNARIIALQGMHDLAYMLASNTIQYLTQDTFVKVTGDYEEVLREEYGITEEAVKVSPFALNVNFEVLVHDGSIPGSEYADVWQQLLQISQMNPDLYQQIDFTRVWLHIARLLGAKDPAQFLKKSKPKVLPDQQVEKGVQAGNYVKPEELSK